MIQSALLSYVINALWQAPLILAVGWLAARLARRVSLTLEHRIWISALLFESLLPACPSLPRNISQQIHQVFTNLWHHADPSATTQITISTVATDIHPGLQISAHLLAAMAVVYLSTLVYFAGRLIHSLFKTLALRRSAHPLKHTDEDTAQRFARIFRVSQFQFATSPLIATPSTIGIRHRLLLLPNRLPETLAPEDLEAAIAHEFAHMHRRDFALNLLYKLIALPVAFHPAHWLTMSRVTETREMICDSLAAEALALPPAERSLSYARSLIRLASLLIKDAPASNLHAIGIFDANIFERRLMNLTQTPARVHGIRRLAIICGCIVLALGTCATALALRTVPIAATPQASVAPDPKATPTPHVASGVIAGSRVSGRNPVYPPDAKAAKLSGTVILHAIIGKDGSIEDLNFVSGPEVFRQSALDAVHQWTYKPYVLNGEPTAVATNITVNYSIPNGKK
jgi:TonB family protein